MHKQSHTGENTFKCHICEKAFAQLSNLENHKLSHTGKKLKAFAQSVNLKTYKLFHTEEKHLWEILLTMKIMLMKTTTMILTVKWD